MKQRHDNHYRYPGSRPFSDSNLDRKLFFGRDSEIKYLFHSILVENLFVLFARSGIGKTSLLNAGLLELLRLGDFLPLVIRFNDPETPPLKAIYPGIEEAVKQRNKQVDEGGLIDYEPGDRNSLWEYFKTADFWSADNRSLTPVLVFDQFEEFFALHPPEQRDAFITQLADLVRGGVPKSLRPIFRSGSRFPYSETAPNVKIIMAVREDYLGYLEELTHAIPNILKNRFRLLPLKCDQARDAIIKPAQLPQDELVRSKGFSYADDTVDEMLGFLCERRERDQVIQTNEVEPFQLQLLCHHIEEKVVQQREQKSRGYVVKKRDLGGKSGMKQVLQGFYESCMKAVGSVWKRRRVRRLCEKGLIENERRVSRDENRLKKKYKVSAETLARLVDNRLLRCEPRVGSIYYELSHDTLVEPILESHQKRVIKKTSIIMPALLFLLIFGANFARLKIDKYKTVNNLYKEAGELIQLGIYPDAITRYNEIMKFTRKRVSIYMEIGQLYERMGEYDSAVKSYKEALEIKNIGSKEAIINYRLGRIYADHKKKPETAIELYNKAIESDPEQIEFHIVLADIYRKLRRYDEAAMKYEDALEIDMGNASAHTGLALVFINQGKPDDANDQYRKALEVTPTNADIYRSIEGELIKRRMTDELIKLYQIAAAARSGKASYYKEIGDGFNELKKYDSAVNCYKKALQIDKDESIYVRLAVTYINQEKPDEAIKLYQKAVGVNSDYADIYSDIALAMENKKMFGQRERLYQIASEAGSEKAAYYEKLGNAFTNLKEYNRAVENYEKALKIDKKHEPAYTGLALVFITQGKPDEANNVYLDALGVSEDLVPIIRSIAYSMKNKGMKRDLINLYKTALYFKSTGAAYYEKLGYEFNKLKAYDWAAKAFGKVTTDEPKNASAWLQQGLAYRKIGNYDQAVRCYTESVKNDPENYFTYNLLGIAYGREGKYKESIESYERALRIKPDYITAWANLAEVTLVAGDFEEAFKLANRILRKPGVSTMHKLAMKFIICASLFFQDRQYKACREMEHLIKYYKYAIDYKPWEYYLSEKFIKESDLRNNAKDLLLELIAILESPRKVSPEKMDEVQESVRKIYSDNNYISGE